MKIPLIYCALKSRFPELNAFIISEWNELDELPKIALDFCKEAAKTDMRYNIYNFMLDFNLMEPITQNKYFIFIPDKKFINLWQ
jgi:hypothetical protein